MKKIKKIKEIGSKHFDGMLHRVTYGDLLSLKLDLLPTDIIEIIREDNFYSENESYDEYTMLVVSREIEETDEEFDRRIKREKEDKEFLKKRRYENYLKLKKEFESGDFQLDT